ncbi:MAG: NAD(P)/FAD-dependent oxidoreductase [Chloroflexi bacterium]|nr:NAD(P)/FAD-dependent oxidoreductase [Chloroflexota bacterium]MCL5274030.1 NAD(P)/FAD-dependent oxidoreductase [Chloroflexota bacterium]
MNIAIIGAGATGLTAALDLLKSGHQVTIYELNDRPGGLAAGFRSPGWEWSLEKFYHHWFASDSDVLQLGTEIGVREKMIFNRPVTVVYYEGRFYQLDGALSTLFPKLPWLDKLPLSGSLARGLLALKFPGLSLLDTARYGMLGMYLVLTSNWRKLEQVTAHEWLSKWAGQRGYKVLWEPLLIGKFGEELYREVNMAWMWARIKARTPRLGTFVGGFQAFFDALAAAVQKAGGQLRYQTRVDAITPITGNRWAVTAEPSDAGNNAASSDEYDQVLVTTSPRLMTRLVPQLPPDYLNTLQNLKSLGAVVMIAALDRQLSTQGFYWHNLPKSSGFPFLAMCEHTNFVSSEHFGGQHLIYCGDYVPVTHPYFKMSEDELRATYLSALKRFNASFDPSWVQQTWVFREPYAQPVPFVNHSRNIPATRTPLPGLFYASMSHVYPWDRGTNFAVRLGREVAAEMLRD